MKRLMSLLFALLVLPLSTAAARATATPATATPQPLPFAQAWTNTALITTNDNWSGVPGIVGYQGDDLVTTTGADPQTVLAAGISTPIDVNANQADPNTFTAGGVTEFELADPTIALRGSNTADAPFVLLHLNTTGLQSIQVSYKLRDLDGSTDNAVQQVALHFRVGSAGDFTNAPAGYVADATTGPSLATLVTPVAVTLPAAADNQAELQVRIMTTNAVGNDEWVGVDDLQVTGTPLGGDLAPTVVSTTPTNGATGVAADANISLTFSEPVTVAGAWFDIACATSGAHAAGSSGGPTTFVLDPDVNFTAGEQCTVTVKAAQVSDVDVDDPPDGMAADTAWSFTVVAAGAACGDPATAIGAVQGTGAASPLVGSQVTVEGTVGGDFQGASRLNGYYLQDAPGDGDPLTSDGIFVFDPAAPDVAAGDRVRVAGTVAEFNGLTELTTITAQTVCSAGAPPAPLTVHLPEGVDGELERYEGMLVQIPETLTVSQNYFQGRYGQVTLSANGRMYVPLNGNGLGDTADTNARRMLVLDDGSSVQNPNPIPYLGPNNTLRAGDTVDGLTGVIESGLIDASGTRDYRLQPVSTPTFTRVNARSAAPAPVGGTLKVASMNVLNYFTTLDTGAPICGPAQDQGCRGANTAAELTRQRDKILAALIALDADVVGLMEIENTDNAATADLVAGLNAHFGAGTYDAVAPPSPGTDAIRVGLIYRPAVVTPVGAAHNYQTSTAAYNPLFDRPPLARVFRQVATGEVFAVVVNHFKSKGSCPASGPDVDLGQGCWNAKRVAQATALLGIIQTLQPVDPDVLVLGDLNSYGAEDPIVTLTGGGLVNLVAARVPAASRYSYVFDGEAGYLDQALATGPLAGQVRGATIWHINADEPSVLDYNTEFKPQDLYAPTPYRSSDHDPVVVGLQLGVRLLYLPLIFK